MPLMAQKSKHVHKLKKHKFKSGNQIYFCVEPDCNVKIAPALALGKRCICWRCSEEFIMNEYSVRLTKPHCDKCHKPKGSKNDGAGYNADNHISIDEPIPTSPLSLAERLQQQIQQAKPTNDEDI